MGYFLGVFIPSFAFLILTGYLFATTLRLKGSNLLYVATPCILSLFCMILSALSILYLISFFGGLLTLMALIKAHAKLAFEALRKRVAFFMVEIGTVFVGLFSSLSLLMWLLCNVFETYAGGFHAGYSPYALFFVGALSFLMFFVILLWGSQSSNITLFGAVGLMLAVLSFLFVVQNQYVFFKAPVYSSMVMLVLGSVSTLIGEIAYLRFFFSESAAAKRARASSSPLYHGTYCPHCGQPRVTTSPNLCSYCGRSLMWTPYAPFCSSCGRLVLTNAQICPHCKEDIGDKRILFGLMKAKELAIANKLITESRRRESWLVKGLLRILKRLRKIRKDPLGSLSRPFNVMMKRLSLDSKDVFFILVLTCLFWLLSFVGYVRVQPSKLEAIDILVSSYGFPLHWLQVKALPPSNVFDVVFLWIPLALDFMVYFFVSLTLVYGVTRLRR